MRGYKSGFARFAGVFLCAGLLSVAAAEIEPPTGTITATPAVCNIPPGSTVCSSTISWWANKPTPNVWVTPLDNSNPQLFASGSTREQVAPWITTAGSRFHLKTTGGVLMATVVAKGNLAPDITFSGPAAGTYLSPAAFNVSATASDPDGTIQRVEFWADGQLLAARTAAPYTATWSNIGAGNHTINAVAFDNYGHRRDSSASSFTVRDPIRNAQFVSQSVPTSILMGVTQSVSIQMKNTGDYTWRSSENYKLGSQNPADNNTWGASRISLPSDIAPGQTGTFNFTMTAPSTPGTYNFQWRMLQEGTAWFGDQSANVVITVRPSNVIGHIDGVTTDGLGQLQLGGWACSTELNQSIDVHMYAGGPYGTGTLVGAYRADQSSEAAVAAACSASGSNYRFRIPLTTAIRQQHGGKTIYVYGISPVGRSNLLIASSGAFAVPAMPAVSMTAPSSGAIINGPTNIALSANASVSTASITKVEFYNGATKVSTATSAPYNATWPNVQPGNYALTAKAYDSAGAVSTSAVSNLVVNAVPVASISAPTNGAVVVAPANVLIQTAVSDPDDGIAMVEFYVNGQLKATDIAAPFTLQADNMPAGIYSLTIKAYDNRGGATVSAASTLIVNERPQVSVVSPANNAAVVVPKTITLAATASDIDGTIERVEFYNGTTLLGTATAAPYQLSWNVTAPGDYSLTARAYDNRGTSTTSVPSVLRGRLEAFEVIGDGGIVDLSGELPIHDASVGKLAGTPGTAGGAATYSISVSVPPGRRGMEPKVGLSYSSRSGNGAAGMGWSLSGGSAIQRCPATLDQDGQVRPVLLDVGDRLCLDGQRLLATSGTYGLAGTTYGTEVESFVRVTQLGGGLGSASSYFKVERKSGEVSYYGNGVNGRVIPGEKSVPLSWLVNRTEDRVGNFVEYRYANFAEGETLLSAILYTGFGSTPGDRRVEFAYETRPDVEQTTSYLGGGLTRQTQRLRFINTFVGSESVRSYQLRYDTTSAHTGRSLLRGVTECAYATTGTVCRPETTFAWQEAAGAPPFKSFSIANLPASENLSSLTTIGDLDGDGIQELYAKYKTTTNPAGPFAGYIIAVDADRQVRGALAIEDVFGVDARTYSMSRHANVDFNKDGRTDVLGTQTIGGVRQLSVAEWNGNTTQWLASSFNTYLLGFEIPDDTSFPTAEDFNGDGFTDLLIFDGPDESSKRLKIYLGKRGATIGQPAVNTVPAVDLAVPAAMITDAYGSRYKSYTVERIEDFDGDGLPDIFLTRESSRGEHDKPQLLWFGRTGTGGLYSLAGAGNEIATMKALAVPQLEVDETHVSALQQWLDVNGDGLTDFISAKRLADGNGYWTVRLNKGGYLGPRIITSGRRGLERCVDTSDGYLSATCVDRWRPMFLPQFSPGDTNTDGAVEMLVPRAFAARICGLRSVQRSNGEPATEYYCPEHPVTGEKGPYPSEFVPTEDRMPAVYGDGGSSIFQGRFDASAYYMDALRFVQTSATSFRVDVANTSIVQGGDKATIDLYGDGLQDQVSFLGCPWKPISAGGNTSCYAFVWWQDPTWGPSSLPNGAGSVSTLVGSRKPFISENTGAGARTSLPPLLPDLLAKVTDGLGNESFWDYVPLSSKAGRGQGETPLYSIPASTALRYVDDRHVYFTSSMPVVSEMIQSDGAGSYRSWRYGYGEAMYHTRGRGFQGFRSIIEDDEGAGIRTTSFFHQKFPLTSQLESMVVNPIIRAGITGPIRSETYAWRCNRGDRNDVAACLNATGGTTVFPYLDSKDSWTYDATIAANPAGGEPPAIGRVKEVNADDATCSEGYATTSGFDAYGNLTARTVHVQDLSSGVGGFRAFLSDQCQRELTSFTADTGNWWLDRVDQKSVATSVSWNASEHPLPANTANPTQSIITQYTWNADRTLATETLQPGVAKQQRVTAYVYSAPTNYGLPTGVGVSADGDPNGTRSSGTAYSADGYFPRSLTNALQHVSITDVRARDGLPYASTDANGLRTLIQYDAFGNPVRKQFRGRTDAEYLAPDANIAVTRCSGACAPQFGVYAITEVQNGASTKVSYLDALGRTLLAKTRLQDGTFTQASTAYNGLGQVTQQSEPYRTGESVYWTTFAYDLLGRMTSKISPQANHDGRGDRATTYTYSGRQTQIRVCGTADSGTGQCLNLSRTTDSLGRYVETLDAQGGRTRFWYNPSGGALALEDAKGVVTRASYNAVGHRTSVGDPNQGIWNFAYDALGELLTQTDARQVSTSLAYDKLGRPTARTASVDVTGDGVADVVSDSWTYDPSNALGQALSSQRQINGVLERSTTLTYDNLVRPIESNVTQAMTSGTQAYRLRQKYDSYYGRLVGQEYPNGEAIELQYSAYGHALREVDPKTGVKYRVTTSTDARGAVTGEQFADANLTGTRQFMPQTGQLLSVQYGNLGNSNLRKLEYRYDVFGNLTTQSLNSGVSTEAYKYDTLHRLTEATRSGAATGTVSYGYDVVGNFTFKSDFSVAIANAYSYTGGTCGGGPNAVKSVQTSSGTRTYCFDANGNLTADSVGLSVKYDHQNLPVVAQRGAMRDDFRYGPDGQRTRSWGSDGARVYLPGYEHRTDTGETKVYIGDYAVVTSAGSTRTVEYLLKDRLGSVDAVTDATGSVKETRGYDAFGKPRSGTWADLNPAKLQSTATTPKGFTQHEHLNQLELIHMNGRMFDYNMGRFTGVDPFIQAPLNSQSLNPYSYIMNNPLSGTDPTGYQSCGEEGRTGGASSVGGGTCDVPGRDGDSKWEFATQGAHARYLNTGSLTITPDNGAKGQGATGGGTLQDRNGSLSQKGSSANNANGAVGGAVSTHTEVTGASVGGSSSNGSYVQMAIAAAEQVETMVSSMDGAQDLSGFTDQVHGRIEELTSQTGFEYRAAISSKSITSIAGEEKAVYSAIISTSRSPVISAPALLSDGDFKYMRGADLHTHGYFQSNYKITPLDAAYLSANSFYVSAGTKLHGKALTTANNVVDRYNPSGQDKGSQYGGFLSTPRGLIPYGP